MANILDAKEMNVINIGIRDFSESISKQSVPVINIEWKPPAGGNIELIEILDRLKKYL